MNLPDDGSFRSAGEIDDDLPDLFGFYAIRLKNGATLQEPFETLLAGRDTRLIYVGQAEKQTLLKRLLGNDFMQSDREAKASLRAQQKALNDQEARLVDLGAEGQLPIAKIRERLDLITPQKAAIAEKLSGTEVRMQLGSEQVLAFVDLLERPGRLHEDVAEVCAETCFSRSSASSACTTIRAALNANALRSTKHSMHGKHSSSLPTPTTPQTKRKEPPAFLRKALLLRPPLASTSPMV